MSARNMTYGCHVLQIELLRSDVASLTKKLNALEGAKA